MIPGRPIRSCASPKFLPSTSNSCPARTTRHSESGNAHRARPRPRSPTRGRRAGCSCALSATDAGADRRRDADMTSRARRVSPGRSNPLEPSSPGPPAASSAGPLATEPSRLNLLPWHGQSIVPSAILSTVQPLCVQVDEKPLNTPAVGWVTTTLSTITPDPTGTSAVLAMTFAAGAAAVPPVAGGAGGRRAGFTRRFRLLAVGAAGSDDGGHQAKPSAEQNLLPRDGELSNVHGIPFS